MRAGWTAAALGVALSGWATAQVAILQIQVLEGEGGVYRTGARIARPLLEEVSDETGHPIAGAAVSFHLPEQGAGGTFLNGLRTDVVTTDERGRAALRNLQLNRVPGRFQIRVIASKEQARAGMVSFQYIAGPAESPARESGSAIRPASPPAATAHVRHGRGKWIAIVALGAGGTAAGLAATRGSSHTAAVPLSIGAPSLTVGKP